jgi:hypothetical protein
MNEMQWLACSNAEQMLEFMRGKSRIRRYRLFACACARGFWDRLTDDRCRRAIISAEFYADQIVTLRDLRRMGSEALKVVQNGYNTQTRGTPESKAADMAYIAADGRSFNSTIMVLRDLDDSKKQSLTLIVHDLFGNPFRPIALSGEWLAWNSAIVVRLAQAAYDERTLPAGTLDNARLAVLSDALEEAGCADEQILMHLRSGGEHYRGCWVIDLLLGKQ